MRRHAHMISLVGIFAVLLMLATNASAGDQKDRLYTSALGFQFKAPADWQRIDLSTVGGLEGNIPVNLKDAMDKGIDVVFYDTSMDKDQFADNISVTVSSLTLPDVPKEKVIRTLGDRVQNDLSKDGVKVSLLSLSDVSVDGEKAIDTTWKFKTSGTTGRLRQIIVPLQKATLLITCTMAAENFAKKQPLCDEVVESLNLGDLKK